MLLKPFDAIQRITLCLSQHGKPFTLQAGEELMNLTPDDEPLFYCISHGQIRYEFIKNKFWLASVKAPSILGIVSYYHPLRMGKFFAELDCEGFVIPAKEAIRLLDEHELWKDVVDFLSYTVKKMLEHEMLLSSGKTYNIVCYHLRQLENEDDHIRNNISILQYLLQHTSYSRSIISVFISELKKGGYIVVERGHLRKINQLPDRF